MMPCRHMVAVAVNGLKYYILFRLLSDAFSQVSVLEIWLQLLWQKCLEFHSENLSHLLFSYTFSFDTSL